ncbi:MIP/aquaporin family protein [Pedobacter endophyticus]|uniref:Aquaporin family protein n=1 Tax=Pedobacter endophyticus TaxID=2789740 RepID=A0A7S9KZN1_9SPHI|nr:MIP/aquaporin family protein [Pedobacter endophyticus]QPH39808.1 aquaporin family protein [Pedobacter endophyticus]
MNVYLAEFIGTALMILLGNGVVANVVLKGTKGNGGGWMVITTAWALAVFIGVVIAGPSSGAHLNPAVTLGLAIGKGFDWHLVPFYILAQIGGAMLGSFLVWIMYKDYFDATEEQALKAAPFATAPAIRNKMSNLLSEIIGTFVLILVIFHFTDASMGPKESATPIGLGSMGAIPVTFLVWVIGLSLGGTTGYAINPARDLGPRIVHALVPMKGKGGSDWGYAWVPIIGPIIGSILAALLFCALNM